VPLLSHARRRRRLDFFRAERTPVPIARPPRQAARTLYARAQPVAGSSRAGAQLMTAARMSTRATRNPEARTPRPEGV